MFWIVKLIMALSEDNSDCNSDSSADGATKQDRREKLFTKIVVRRLPPSMSKDVFLNQVSPLPDFDYIYFVKADISLGEYAFSRAYINFKNPADIFIFKEKFDNYVFLDAKGNEYVAVVEFAPFSRIPKRRNRVKVDPKCSSIETDPVYLEFVESLKEITNDAEEKPEYCFQPSTEDEKKVVNTPLLDYIKQRRIDRQKMKEEKREERKRRELERKRIKDDDRKGRKRIDHISHSNINIKTSPNKTGSSFDFDESKSESALKKDKKTDDYRPKFGKPNILSDWGDKRTSYISSKDSHRNTDRKSPSKIRPRNSNYEKDSRRVDYKSKRDDVGRYNKEGRDEEKVIEKKVKKYSERREERKNEFIKKSEPTNVPATSEYKTDQQSKTKSDENKTEPESRRKNNETEEPKKAKSEIDQAPTSKEHHYHERKKDDPRTQRRIRNKDRPTMAIYQPGMRFRQKKSDSNDDGEKNITESEPKSE